MNSSKIMCGVMGVEALKLTGPFPVPMGSKDDMLHFDAQCCGRMVMPRGKRTCISSEAGSPDRPECISFDLDDTLARNDERMYDAILASKCKTTDYLKSQLWKNNFQNGDNFHKDKPINKGLQYVKYVEAMGYTIVYLSARYAKCVGKSIDWLEKNDFPEGEVIHKTEGTATDFKEAQLKKLKEKYDVLAHFDDQDDIVALSKEVGVKIVKVEANKWVSDETREKHKDRNLWNLQDLKGSGRRSYEDWKKENQKILLKLDKVDESVAKQEQCLQELKNRLSAEDVRIQEEKEQQRKKEDKRFKEEMAAYNKELEAVKAEADTNCDVVRTYNVLAPEMNSHKSFKDEQERFQAQTNIIENELKEGLRPIYMFQELSNNGKTGLIKANQKEEPKDEKTRKRQERDQKFRTQAVDGEESKPLECDNYEWAKKYKDFFENKTKQLGNYEFAFTTYHKQGMSIEGEKDEITDGMGVAVAYPTEKYTKVDENEVQLSSEFAAEKKPVLGNPRLNKALMVRLERKANEKQFVVATYHMPCEMADVHGSADPTVMAFHAMWLRMAVDDFAEGDPYILAGDFNMVSTRSNVRTFLDLMSAGENLSKVLQKANILQTKGGKKGHTIKTSEGLKEALKGEYQEYKEKMENYNKDGKGTGLLEKNGTYKTPALASLYDQYWMPPQTNHSRDLDHILVNGFALRPGCLLPVRPNTDSRMTNERPSDHVMIGGVVEITQ